MRCGTIEKWISDELDGDLSGRKIRRLDLHLAACAACRAYRNRLERLQREAGPLRAPSVPADYWETSVARLQQKIRSEAPAPATARPRPTLSPRMRWAWSGSAGLLAAAVFLVLAVFRMNPPLEPYPISFEEAVNGVFSQIGDNAELEKDFDVVVLASIREHAGPADDDVKRLLYGSSLFIDSLSDEEVKLLDEQVIWELKI
jgi:hypothetical protein